MTPFTRINLNINTKPVSEVLKELVQKSGGSERAKYKHTNDIPDRDIAEIRLYSVDTITSDYLINQLPKAVLDIERPKVFYMEVDCAEGANYLPPHIDRGRRCAINLYTKCAGEKTIFYGDVQDVFIAKDNEVWALDVSKPHSVQFNKNGIRTGYTFSFKHAKYRHLIHALECIYE